MTTLIDTGFEDALLTGWSQQVGSALSLVTDVKYAGAASAYFDKPASTAHFQLDLTSKRVVVGRLYYRLDSDPGGTTPIIMCPNANGDIQISARAGRKLRTQVGTTYGADSTAVLTIGTWYRIDFRFDTSGATATCEAQIDGTAIATASRTQTAADMTTFRVGGSGTWTMQAHFDAIRATDVSGDYPLGALVTVPVWTTPADTVGMSTTPELKFTSPASAVAQHFYLELDTANTFNTGNLRQYDSSSVQTNWAYWNGSAWTAMPAGGMPSGSSGNEVRYTVTSALSAATWYRRVRAGTQA